MVMKSILECGDKKNFKLAHMSKEKKYAEKVSYLLAIVAMLKLLNLQKTILNKIISI